MFKAEYIVYLSMYI